MKLQRERGGRGGGGGGGEGEGRGRVRGRRRIGNGMQGGIQKVKKEGTIEEEVLEVLEFVERERGNGG
ncbi:hypothetical protein Csa_008592 [Cucumis sativus]|uniref:Uncharacterized protein n=1 Tax=Cucumis sativus TaxID=3659 RepID=A0A0A0KT97_CUCSA|nr:hypothetical protein Csa_008592 [Cucumis sativus]